MIYFTFTIKNIQVLVLDYSVVAWSMSIARNFIECGCWNMLVRKRCDKIDCEPVNNVRGAHFKRVEGD